MTSLREAAQAALEALEFYYDQHGEESDAKVITALRAALAEPVQERGAAWENKYGMKEWEVHALRAGWMPAPPQRKPEPVALDWLHKWANQDDGEPETQWHEGYEAARRVVQIHLTAPPQRKPPATIDEMFDRMDKAPRGVFFGHDPMTIWMEAWRAAEQHHGIKEGT
jgi:hypothetical protein